MTTDGGFEPVLKQVSHDDDNGGGGFSPLREVQCQREDRCDEMLPLLPTFLPSCHDFKLVLLELGHPQNSSAQLTSVNVPIPGRPRCLGSITHLSMPARSHLSFVASSTQRVDVRPSGYLRRR